MGAIDKLVSALDYPQEVPAGLLDYRFKVDDGLENGQGVS